MNEYVAKAAEAAHLLAESVRTTHRLDAVISELEMQLRKVREENVALRGKLLQAEVEIARLTNELNEWKS